MNGDEVAIAVATVLRWANFLYMLTHSMREELCPECMAKFNERIGHTIRVNEKMYRICRKESLGPLGGKT